MKRTSLTGAMLLFLVSPTLVMAVEQAVLVEEQASVLEQRALLLEEQVVLLEEQAVPDDTTVSAVSEAEVSTPANPPTSRQMRQMGMMHKGKGQHGKGQGGMMHGGGKHGGGKHGKGMHQKHEQVVHRLDMIEARMAKIEAMLEILIRR